MDHRVAGTGHVEQVPRTGLHDDDVGSEGGDVALHCFCHVPKPPHLFWARSPSIRNIGTLMMEQPRIARFHTASPGCADNPCTPGSASRPCARVAA